MVITTGNTIVRASAAAGKGLASAVVLALLAACQAPLQMKQVWEDPAYGGSRPKKVLVMCTMTVPTVKRAFENEFVRSLKAGGTEAVESFRVVPDGSLEDDAFRESVVALVREKGFDAVLITRAMKGRTEVTEIPGMTIVSGFGYGPYGGYGGVGISATIGGPSQPTTQGYTHEQEFLTIDTLLFDVGTGQRVWAARSELRVTGSPQEHVKPYVSHTTGELAKAKFFRK